MSAKKRNTPNYKERLILASKKALHRLKENANLPCRACKRKKLRYWGETSEDLILKCRSCSKLTIIPLTNDNRLRQYFSQL